VYVCGTEGDKGNRGKSERQIERATRKKIREERMRYDEPLHEKERPESKKKRLRETRAAFQI
jgi:hypothetical protein